ncbi:MAG: hypothetical protein MUO68_03500, partial [Desulfobacteraceae bacterium]|nr:hypothetical protein [Desulfobacteraceae bacterium]
PFPRNLVFNQLAKECSLAFGLLFFSLSAKLDSLYLYRKLIELYTLKPFFSTYERELSHQKPCK